MRRSFRLRRSPVVFWLVAVVLAALTGTVVARLVDRAAAAAARYGSPADVVVVRRAVGAGDRVERRDVEHRRVPGAFVPPGAVRADAAVGRVAVVPLLPGQVVVADQLAPGGLSAVAALVPRGRMAIALPTGGLAPPLRRGDVVDVVATFDDGVDPPTFAVAEGATVVAVDDDAVTVAVERADIDRVTYAVTSGVVTIVLAGAR